MACDIVFPDNNEEEFISLASKLGFDSLIFIYKDTKNFYKKSNPNIKIFNAVITKKEKAQSFKKKSKLIIVEASGDDRDVFERYKPNIVFAIEDKQKKDYMHQRGSGFNSVFANLAVKNKILLGFSFSSLLKNERMRERVIGRMMQNIKLCRKYKTKMCIASFAKKPYDMRSYHDLLAFFIRLGMEPKEAKAAFKSALKIISKNQ